MKQPSPPDDPARPTLILRVSGAQAGAQLQTAAEDGINNVTGVPMGASDGTGVPNQDRPPTT